MEIAELNKSIKHLEDTLAIPYHERRGAVAYGDDRRIIGAYRAKCGKIIVEIRNGRDKCEKCIS
jgi:uncharacterized OB-fold protein